MPQSKDIQEEMRNKVTDICQCGKCYKALGLEPTTVTLYANGENMEQR